MARLPIPGSDVGTWGTILNEFLSVSHNNDGMPKNTGVIAEKYTLPAGGVPETDLASAVQTKLNASMNSATILALTDPRFIYHPNPSITHNIAYEFASSSETSGTTTLQVSGNISTAVASHGLSVSASGVTLGHMNAILWPHSLGVGECVESAISVTCRAVNYSLTGLLMSDGTTASSNIAGISLTGQSSGVRAFEPMSGTFNAPDATPTGADGGAFFMSFQDQIRIRVTRVGVSAVRVEVGDGVTWSQHGLDWEWNPGFTPTHIGFFASDYGGNFPVFMRAEYLRTYNP
ncbi:MAG: hypothetical protein QG553_787 [Patescibacteria group bacterium]|nr:hypothetical protein [Patescibacteria group bacterium]